MFFEYCKGLFNHSFSRGKIGELMVRNETRTGGANNFSNIACSAVCAPVFYAICL